MQRMALDPFAAVDQAPQGAQRAVDANTASVLHRVTRAHLIGNRADAADARGDVWRLREFSAPQKCLEEARRLENFQFHVGNLALP